ncbi:MAG TPA: sialidase family protein [Herpetosiphonaceae bacterium]
MRHLFLIWLALTIALPSAISAQATGDAPPAGVVWRLTGSASGNIFAGTWCGVYQLAADGTRWQDVPGLRDVPARRLVRLDGNVLLAATAGWWPGGIWRYAPGEGWRRVHDTGDAHLAANPSGTRVYAVFVGPAGPYGPTLNVLRSDDSGRTWNEVGHPGYALPMGLEVAVDPRSGQEIVLLATQAQRLGGTHLLRSLDGGATWETFPGYTDDIRQADSPLLMLDKDNATLYFSNRKQHFATGASTTRLYRGSAAGSGLEAVALPADLERHGLIDLVAHGNTLIAAGSSSVFRGERTGTGDSWTRIDEGLGRPTIFDLHDASAAASDPASVYAATSISVYRYDAAADRWRYVAPGIAPCNAPGRTVYERIPSFSSGPDHQFFPETGHSLSSGFKAFWERNGGLPVFGFPLSEEFDERNADLQRAFTTQYFERERLEYHPENAGTIFTTLLGRLGAELLAAQGRDWRQEDGTDNPFPGGTGPCRAFNVGDERRSVCGPFLQFWQSHGLDLHRGAISYDESLLLFGYPLSAPRLEVNPDGDRVLTQWFERARFEYHPNNPDPYKVLLGRLGSEVLRSRGIAVP